MVISRPSTTKNSLLLFTSNALAHVLTAEGGEAVLHLPLHCGLYALQHLFGAVCVNEKRTVVIDIIITGAQGSYAFLSSFSAHKPPLYH